MFKLIGPHNASRHHEDKNEVLKRINDIYAGPHRGLQEESRYWLYARHPEYGIIGGLSLKPSEFNGLLKKGDDMLADFSGSSPKGWSVTHLFFHLDDQVMDEMDDLQLKIFLGNFYGELYKSLLELSTAYNIPYFSIIASVSEHISAVQLGSLPFEYETPFELKGEEYILSFLTGAPQMHDLISPHAAVNPLPVMTESFYHIN